MATSRAQGSIAHIRIPEEMRAQLKIRAILNRRTMNAEILHLIEAGQAAIDGANAKAADKPELADR